jgi:cytochrome c oxidase subunit 2
MVKPLRTAAWKLPPLALCVAVCALSSACNEAHPRDTLLPTSDMGDVSAWFYHMLLGVDLVIMAIVAAVWAIAIVKFRRKAGDNTLPDQGFGNMKLEVAWTILPTIIVIGIAVPAVGGIFKLAENPDPNQKVIEVEVTGKQWWWEFDYVKEKINTANELHVEVGTQVALRMTSADVIHAWWVPRIGGKRDATPGRRQIMTFRAREPGIFDGQCAELCGASHALMGTRIIVHPAAGEDSYEDWVQHQQEKGAEPKTPAEEAGKKVFMEKGCVACHTIQGVAELAPGARSRASGPNLTHVGSRTRIAANTLENTVDNLAKWVKNPQSVKPGALMTNLGLDDKQAKDVATYLKSLQ